MLINISYLTILIGSVCIPNKSDENVNNIYFDNVELLCERHFNAVFLLLDDFNLPLANFSNVHSRFDDKSAF